MRWPTGHAARDAVAAVIIIAIGVAGMLHGLRFPSRAAAWPLWMWGLLVLFSLILLANSFRRPRAPRSQDAVGSDEERERASE